MSAYKFISVLAWAIGYFPFKSPCSNSGRAPCCSFANVYTVTVILLGTFVDVDLIMNKPLFYIKVAPLVKRIIFVSGAIVETILPLALRITGVAYGRKFCSAVRDLEKFSLLGLKRGTDSFKIRVFVVMVVLSALCGAFWVRIVVTFTDPTVDNDDQTALDRFLSLVWEPLVRFNNARALINPTICTLVATWVVICVGVQMKSAHKAVYDLLVSSFQSNSSNRDDSAVGLFRHLLRLKVAFELCAKVIVVYMLMVFMLGITSLTYGIYVLIWPQDEVVGFIDFFGVIVQVLLLVFLGHSLESQGTSKREELKEVLESYNSASLFRPSKLLAVGIHATELDWSVTAGSVFKVNLYSVPGMISAWTTYTIFMIHLQLSEDEANQGYN